MKLPWWSDGSEIEIDRFCSLNFLCVSCSRFDLVHMCLCPQLSCNYVIIYFYFFFLFQLLCEGTTTASTIITTKAIATTFWTKTNKTNRLFHQLIFIILDSLSSFSIPIRLLIERTFFFCFSCLPFVFILECMSARCVCVRKKGDNK